MMNIAHPPSRPANDHADKAALFDSINFPGADEDLLVELSVPVKTIGASGRAVSNTTVLHFPLEVRQELSEPGLQGQFQQQRRKPHITSLTSSPIAPYCSRPGTPIPREPAEEDHSCTQPLPAFKRTTSVVDIHRRADGHQADHLRVKHSDTSGHRLKPAFMLPGFIEDQTAHLRAAVPTRIMPLSPFPLMMPESSNASKYEVTYKAVARQSVNLPSHQEIYDSALNVRSEELDKLREELGIEVGKVPALPPKSDPRQRAWAKPLIARFDELISQEMRKIWVEARKLALNTVANAGVDIVPFVKQCSYASEVV